MANYKHDTESVVRLHDGVAQIYNHSNGSLRHRRHGLNVDAIASNAGDVIDQIGCTDVFPELYRSGALEAIGPALFFGHTDYDGSQFNRTAMGVLSSVNDSIHTPTEFGYTNHRVDVDPREAHEANDAAIINSGFSQRETINANRGAASIVSLHGVDTVRLAETMPYLSKTRVFSIGTGNASLSALWALRDLGIGTDSGATTVVSMGNVGGIWNSDTHRGVPSRAKNNPGSLTVTGSTLPGATLSGSPDLINGTGTEISEWSNKIGQQIGLQKAFKPGESEFKSSSSSQTANTENTVNQLSGEVVSVDQNIDYSYSITWIDEQGYTQVSTADIVIGGLGLQEPRPFTTDRMPQTDRDGAMLTRDTDSELIFKLNPGVEVYRGTDVNLRVHRWQEDLTALDLHESYKQHNDRPQGQDRKVVIFGLGNSSIEMMRQFDAAGIGYVVVTDYPKRVIASPERTFSVDGKQHRLARNTDPFEFNLQKGIAYDLRTARSTVQDAVADQQIESEVEHVSWSFDDQPNGMGLVVTLRHKDGHETQYPAFADVYSLFGYSPKDGAASKLGMGTTSTGKVNTDICGQVKDDNGYTQHGYFTIGGHMEGGHNKGVIAGFMHMLPNIGFAAIAQSARRHMFDANNRISSLERRSTIFDSIGSFAIKSLLPEREEFLELNAVETYVNELPEYPHGKHSIFKEKNYE